MAMDLKRRKLGKTYPSEKPRPRNPVFASKSPENARGGSEQSDCRGNRNDYVDDGLSRRDILR